nr:MAG TPA: hypothetical protein [Caudoviricetes sp.]
MVEPTRLFSFFTAILPIPPAFHRKRTTCFFCSKTSCFSGSSAPHENCIHRRTYSANSLITQPSEYTSLCLCLVNEYRKRDSRSYPSF